MDSVEGARSAPHQDGHYFKIKPNEAITCWLPMDRTDSVNGSIRYVPGSHRTGMREHVAGDTFGFSLGIENLTAEDMENEVLIQAEPGDLILHHSLTVHRADSNQSNRQRRAIGLIYYAKKAKPDEMALEAYNKSLKKRWTQSDRL